MAESERAIRVKIVEIQGSTPRELGAEMWVWREGIRGSVGGGRMEAAVVQRAREMLENQIDSDELRFTLGPDSGQCCGGQVVLSLEHAQPTDFQRKILAIFGAGHVGSVLARLARAVDFDVKLYDSRPHVDLHKSERYQQVIIPEAVIDTLPKEAMIVILTHDHGEDFLIAERALARGDFNFVGMIGSKTKAARFRSEFKVLGDRLDALHSPIAKGDDKRPEAIALAILTKLLTIH